MTQFVRVWGILDFYTHSGFEVKKLVVMLTQDPILEPFQPILQEGKGKTNLKVSVQKKKKTSNISLFVLAFRMDFHSMF